MLSNLEALRENLGRLNERDRGFAESLLQQAVGRGLSAKQLPWVDKLVLRATTPAESIGDVSGVLELLRRAGKRPRVTLQAGDLKVRLSLSGEQSAFPGTVAITSTEKGFGYRQFYGRVGLDGTFAPGRDASPENLPAIVALLRTLAADPAGTAAAYGKATGECCFCGLELSDGRSLEVGYGGTCAKRYALPWGTKP
jgi:Family of unknown function (DUF6011)